MIKRWARWILRAELGHIGTHVKALEEENEALQRRQLTADGRWHAQNDVIDLLEEKLRVQSTDYVSLLAAILRSSFRGEVTQLEVFSDGCVGEHKAGTCPEWSS